MGNLKDVGDQLIVTVKAYVGAAIDSVSKRIDTLEQKVSATPTVSDVDAKIALIPAGEKGEKGDRGERGEEGKAAEVDYDRIGGAIKEVVATAVAEIPAPKDGNDGADGEAIKGDKGDKGDPGESIKGEPGKDGRDGRDGKDGSPGRDAAEINPVSIDEAKSYPAGTWGRYRGGLLKAERATDPITESVVKSGWAVMVEGVSAIVVSQGDDIRTFSIGAMLTSGAKFITEFSMPAMIYRGVWAEAEFSRGDVTTWGGSAWHCQVEKTTDKPGMSTDWKLMVKSGRDGKDAAMISAKPAEPVRLR